MNIVSCESCGVVFDTLRLTKVEPDIDDPSTGAWDDYKFVAVCNCPACGRKLLRHNGDLA